MISVDRNKGGKLLGANREEPEKALDSSQASKLGIYGYLHSDQEELCVLFCIIGVSTF